MSSWEIQNWIAIYLATFALSLLCAILAAATVLIELVQERFWQSLNDRKSWLLFAPRVWWRWQKRYLLGTPVILGIIAVFAASMDWTQ